MDDFTTIISFGTLKKIFTCTKRHKAFVLLQGAIFIQEPTRVKLFGLRVKFWVMVNRPLHTKRKIEFAHLFYDLHSLINLTKTQNIWKLLLVLFSTIPQLQRTLSNLSLLITENYFAKILHNTCSNPWYGLKSDR